MALVVIKTASMTGYCDCIHGCYEFASLRDEDTGKGFCPQCAKEHLEMNAGIGLPQPAPQDIQIPEKPASHPAHSAFGRSTGMPAPGAPPPALWRINFISHLNE